MKWMVAVTFTALSMNVFATEVSGDTIMDNYVGAGYNGDVNGDVDKYDINRMDVSRDGTMLSVDIFTSFYDDIGSIRLGDLFMATSDGGASPWNPFANPWDPSGAQPYEEDRFAKTDNKATLLRSESSTAKKHPIFLAGCD
jgi:hypothetical protein